jgi:hypothetical protein
MHCEISTRIALLVVMPDAHAVIDIAGEGTPP